MPTEEFTLVADVPAMRVGWHLRGARSARGLNLNDAADGSGLSARLLDDYERGEAAVSDTDLHRLATLYAVDVASLVPPRQPVSVDLGAARLNIGDQSLDLDAPTSEGVLSSYLRLVYSIRGAAPGTPLALRDDDLQVLAEIVGGDTNRIEERLVELMGCSHEEAAAIRRLMIRRRILIPAASLLMGASMITALDLGVDAVDQRVEVVTEIDPTTVSSTTEPPTIRIDIPAPPATETVLPAPPATETEIPATLMPQPDAETANSGAPGTEATPDASLSTTLAQVPDEDAADDGIVHSPDLGNVPPPTVIEP